MESTKDRLKKIIEALEIRPLTPATTCPGITKSMMQKLWSSETGAVSSNILEPFCKTYKQVNCNYLLRGDGPMFISEGSQKDTGGEYYKICKLLLENRQRDTDLYSKLAEMMGR